MEVLVNDKEFLSSAGIQELTIKEVKVEDNSALNKKQITLSFEEGDYGWLVVDAEADEKYRSEYQTKVIALAQAFSSKVNSKKEGQELLIKPAKSYDHMAELLVKLLKGEIEGKKATWKFNVSRKGYVQLPNFGHFVSTEKYKRALEKTQWDKFSVSEYSEGVVTPDDTDDLDKVFQEEAPAQPNF